MCDTSIKNPLTKLCSVPRARSSSLTHRSRMTELPSCYVLTRPNDPDRGKKQVWLKCPAYHARFRCKNNGCQPS